jgi:peptide/nickel transport system substrate-binding protein
MALYDRLVALGPGGKLLPYLAKSWTATPTVLTFQLRTDASCSDGTRITATVVANSFARLFKTYGPAISTQFGPGPYKVSADDSTNTFTLTLGSPYSDAINWIANPVTGILCPAGIANPLTLQTVSAGSGPYTLASALHADSVVLNLRPDWKWGPEGITSATAGLPTKLIMRVVNNESTAANLLLTGGLDIGALTGTDVPRLLAEKSLTSVAAHSYASYPLVFNELPGHPTAELAVRQALATAIDPKAWNQAAYQGRGILTTSPMASNTDCYDPSTAKLLPTPSLEKAKQVLAAAGYTAGSNGQLQRGGKVLSIHFIGTTQLFTNGPEYLVDVFHNLGLAVNAEIADFGTYRNRFAKGDFDVFIEQNPVDVPSPAATSRLSVGNPNPNNTVNAEVNSEAAAAQASTGTDRCAHWHNVQQLLLKNYDLVPLSVPYNYWFSRKITFNAQASWLQPQFLRRVG